MCYCHCRHENWRGHPDTWGECKYATPPADCPERECEGLPPIGPDGNRYKYREDD